MEITVGIPGWPTNFKVKKKKRERQVGKKYSKKPLGKPAMVVDK